MCGSICKVSTVHMSIFYLRNCKGTLSGFNGKCADSKKRNNCKMFHDLNGIHFYVFPNPYSNTLMRGMEFLFMRSFFTTFPIHLSPGLGLYNFCTCSNFVFFPRHSFLCTVIALVGCLWKVIFGREMFVENKADVVDGDIKIDE